LGRRAGRISDSQAALDERFRETGDNVWGHPVRGAA
jgi:hypothetical protein